MADRQGVEIDYCPKCRGVWLDKGELDKLIERSASYNYNDDRDYDDRKHYPPQGGHYNDPHYKHKKKKGFWEIFLISTRSQITQIKGFRRLNHQVT